jgi:uncharacterized membrane protein YfcA
MIELDIITAYTSIIIFFAAIVHSIAGFGFAQVAMGLLPLIRDAQHASVIFNILAIVTNGRVLWSVKDSFDLKSWGLPVIGLVFGMPVGIYFFQSLNPSQFRLGIGLTLLLAVILIISIRQIEYFQNLMKKSTWEPGTKTAILTGFIAGIFGGSVAIPGPPMILYGAFLMASNKWEGNRMKAVFTGFFGTLMLYRLSGLVWAGDVTNALVFEAIIAIPAMLIGSGLGIWIYEKIPENIFQWIVIVGLTINAFILIFTA